jgi:hypothetical protein
MVDSLSHHYAAISRDSAYQTPLQTPFFKQTVTANSDDVILEWQVFKVLD